jgi:MerR family transcriptional regulator, thiopeptide resistance regulator
MKGIRVHSVGRDVFKVRAFAELAGVTVRALHHYDRLALLRPRRTSGGYRMYSAGDLERLEQIVALKFLGFPLKQIKSLLDHDSRRLGDVLRRQRYLLEDKRKRLDKAIAVIAEAERSVQPGRATESAVLRRIIEVFDMSNEKDEMRKYYSEAAWAELSKRGDGPAKRHHDVAMEGTRQWQALFKDVTASLDADPAGPVGQALLDRWKALIDEFTWRQSGDHGRHRPRLAGSRQLDARTEEAGAAVLRSARLGIHRQGEGRSASLKRASRASARGSNLFAVIDVLSQPRRLSDRVLDERAADATSTRGCSDVIGDLRCSSQGAATRPICAQRAPSDDGAVMFGDVNG